MRNFQILFPLVDGSLMDFPCETGRQCIEALATDDWGAPPVSMDFEAIANDGRKVTISIPYSNSDKVHVSISEPDTRRGT